MTSDQTPADVIGQVARVALDALEAKQRADKEAVRAALGDLAVDLDGKEHDYRVEAWEVARALADAGQLVDPADRDEVTFISEEARMRASELDPQAIIRNLIQDKQTIAELVTKNRERAERAEAERDHYHARCDVMLAALGATWEGYWAEWHVGHCAAAEAATELRAKLDRLRAQVAAVEALIWQWENNNDSSRKWAAMRLRAALDTAGGGSDDQ